jgi:GNAT superfamily N-acetyltransferase
VIARVSAATRAQFVTLCGQGGLLGGRIAAAFACHAQHPQVAGFYCVQGTAALLVQGGGALLCGTVADTQELGSFLHFAGAASLTTVSVCPSGWQAVPRTVMQASAGFSVPLPPLPAGTVVENAPSLWQLRASGLLAGVDPDGWYADTCVLVAKGLAQVVAAKQGTQYVATAGLYSLAGQNAYLSGVATAATLRGQGLASALVCHLVKNCPLAAVQLVCEDALCGFYGRLGFLPVGTLLLAQG